MDTLSLTSIIALSIVGVLGWFVRRILFDIDELKKNLSEHIISDTKMQTSLETKLDAAIDLLKDQNERN